MDLFTSTTPACSGLEGEQLGQSIPRASTFLSCCELILDVGWTLSFVKRILSNRVYVHKKLCEENEVSRSIFAHPSTPEPLVNASFGYSAPTWHPSHLSSGVLL